ncbi:hypothetical protein C0989_009270 [Termitomyces sp. Mn162]|nr:hypothetical protein C0989_009270 [Termitomyces sp. Mn162]
MLLQIYESRGHSPLDAAEWLHFDEDGIFTLMHQLAEVMRASQATAEEPSLAAPTMSAAPTEEVPLPSVAVALSTAAPPPSSSSMSSDDAPSEKSMELDYVNDSMMPIPIQPVMTPQVVPSSMEVAVATNIATPTTPEARTSGSSNMANTVLECWADIMSNEEAEASKMDKCNALDV